MTTALLITCYNRPLYLKECFDSIKRADLSRIQTIIIVDDFSTDIKTIELINEFDVEGIEVIKYYKQQNKSIKDSLLYGYEFLFRHGIDIVINLDSDSIVANVFVEKILNLKNKYTHLITSGFNCNTLNKNGTVRHKYLFKEDGAIFRESVGGINLCINREQYLKYIKPALNYTLQHSGNWDALSCINSMADSLPIVVTVPSVIQHCGEISSMNHNAGGEPMDKADDFKPLHLENITLIGVAESDFYNLVKACDISRKHIKFGAVKLLTSIETNHPNLVKIKPLGNKAAYNAFVLKEMINHITTDFFMIIQADGYLLDYRKWSNDFLKVDMVGAKWAWYENNRCSNGGFCIRSRRLHEILRDDETIIPINDHLIKNWEEDHLIGKIYRKYLEEKYNIIYADDELCDRFSIESWRRAYPENKYNGSLGFHGGGIIFEDSDLEHKPY